jgi:hypothetical protein
MATKRSAKSSAITVKPKLADREIQRRLTQIELASVSSLRALQMDIEGEKGVSSATVLDHARAALGSRAKFRAVLANVPAAKPEPGDEL